MGEWKEMKFSDFVEVNPSVKLNRADEHFYIEMQDMDPARRWVHPKRKRPLQGGSRFADGDTLFARISPCTEKGNINQVAGLNGELGYGSTEFLVFREKSKVSDKDFIIYLSKWSEIKEYAANNLQGTSGRQRVAKEVFDELDIVVPDLHEQRAIASVLSSLDAKIDLLHRQNKTLEAMAEALFRQWFVEEAEDGWAEGTVADIADVTSGKRPPERFEESSSEARVPVWGGNGPMAYTREALVDSEVLLTGRVGTLGSIFRINTPIWPSDNTLLLTARRPEAMEFLFQQLRSIDFAQLNRGSTQPLLTQSDLKAQSFLMPPHELLTRYHEISRDWYAKVDANLKTIQTLTALRDTLLPKLMSGEVRVTVP